MSKEFDEFMSNLPEDNQVPDVRKMVEDDVEKLATEWLEKNFYTYAESRGLDNDQWLIEEEDLDKLFEQAKQMELKAKENTYTEEQVREALKYWSDLLDMDYPKREQINKILQSLKQPKQ